MMAHMLCTIFIILFIIGLITSNYDIKLSKTNKIGITLVFISGIILGALMMYNDIKPIDVYRGNTELQIKETKVNSIITKTDSTVIWKK